MPLEGNVKEFGLADVLQFIAGNQKAGVLQLTSKNDKASIAFDHGKITGAVYGRQGRQDQLQNYLLRSKKVQQAKLESILKIQVDTGIPLGELLLKEGLMAQEEIDDLVIFKIQEVLDEVFTWSDARYKFNPEERLYQNSRSQVAVPAESLLLETLRRKDEWPAIAKALPSDGVILKKIQDTVTGLEISTDIQQIFEMIDGSRTISQMIGDTYLGRFRTFNAVYNLLMSGTVEIIHTPEPEAKVAERQAKKTASAAGKIITAAAVLLGLAVLGGAGLGAHRIYLLTAKKNNLIQREAIRARMGWLKNRIDVYYMLNGSYPAILGDITNDRKIISSFDYHRNEEEAGYRLEARQ
ncbi:MAG: DUF4388 domain-containing protein [Candidatus Edwardsbacteria bacterium]|nr:DUF4388 domain-containing protein [Candidatus Edwardsbacteria bacterium]